MATTAFILVIGDSFIAKATHQLLEQHEYRAVVVANLDAATRAMSVIIPDLIILEYSYSVQTLIDSLQKNSKLPYIPLIIAYDNETELVLPSISNIDGFLRCRATTVEQLAQIQLGVHLSRSRREILEQRQQLQLMYDISRTLHRSLDIDNVLQRALELIGKAWNSTRSSILLLDEYGHIWRRILLRDHASMEAETQAVDNVLREGLASYAIRESEIQIVEDATKDKRWLQLERNDNVGSALALPLRNSSSNTISGIMIIVHPVPGYFNRRILPLATALIEQLELAFTNATAHTRLREAEESRQAFIHMLTHDLRTPLSGMISCFDALQTLNIDDTAQFFVELGIQAGEEQQRLIDNILDIYKAETGSMAIRYSSTTLHTLGQIVQRQLGARVIDAGLTLSIDLPANPTILLDESKMARVLMNLISNSIKWTPRAGKVTVEGQIQPNTIIITITDTGVGIDKQDLPYIFNRFYQGRTRSASNGTGLGLTFAKLTIEGHDGTITITSEKGIGTEITISLPRIQNQTT